MIFIGLDKSNNIRKISLLGVGSSCGILVDTKNIIRTALMSTSDRVILVHNHPSNSLHPSKEDIHITNITNNIDKEFKNEDINLLEKALLVEENTKLKNEIKELNYKLENKEMAEENDMEF